MKPGEKLKLVRELVDDLTQDEMAIRVEAPSVEVYKNWERNRSILPLPKAQEIALARGFPWAWFFDEQDVQLPFGQQPNPKLTIRETRGLADTKTVQIPLYPEVPASTWQRPTDAESEPYSVPPALGGPNRFACRIVGDSLSPKVQHGDVAIWHSTTEARVGVITLAQNKDREVTAKVLERNGQAFRLRAVNPDYPTIDMRGVSQLAILIGVVRDLGGGTSLIIVNEGGIRPVNLP